VVNASGELDDNQANSGSTGLQFALAFFDLGRISDGKLRHIKYCLSL